MIERGDLAVAVICDGAGSFAAGGTAAELVSDLLAKTMADRFRELYFCDGPTARLRIAQLIARRLADHSRTAGIPERELACTILASAMDGEGRCICLHLGDGIILQRDRGEPVMRVVSPPMNGLVPGSTYLTMNCDMWRYLRYYRWQSGRTMELLLLTDGAAEHLVCRRGGAGWVLIPEGPTDLKTLKTWLDRHEPRDDHTAARVTREF